MWIDNGDLMLNKDKNTEQTRKAMPRGIPFQKGNKLSPGRPKTAKCIPDILREIGDRPVDPFLLAKLHAQYGPNHTPTTMREAMLMSAADDAARGDTMARSFVAERTEGKVTDRIEFDDVNVTSDNVISTQTNKLLAFAEKLAGEVVRKRTIPRN